MPRNASHQILSLKEESSRYRSMAVIFSAMTSLFYLISDVWKLPLFTFYPASNRFEWGWSAATPDDGPGMYWYGWIATASIGAGFCAILIGLLPDRIIKKIPLSSTWWTSLLLVPVLIYSLKFYWRW